MKVTCPCMQREHQRGHKERGEGPSQYSSLEKVRGTQLLFQTHPTGF